MDELKKRLIDYSNSRSSNHFIDYDDYVSYQTVQGLSFEDTNEKWSGGQRECIESKFKNLDRKIKILDCSCGDGVGLKKLKEMGFCNVVGVEISDEKIDLVKKAGFNVIKGDVCCGPFDFGDEFDVIYSSHTIEHVLNPEYALTNLSKLLRQDGIIFLVLPYPDVRASNQKDDHRFKIHCGVVPLGLHVEDEGKTTCDIIKKMGFDILNCQFHSYREPEVHLTLKHN